MGLAGMTHVYFERVPRRSRRALCWRVLGRAFRETNVHSPRNPIALAVAWVSI
jgi:hypothetical protein